MGILSLQDKIAAMGGFCMDTGTLSIISVGSTILSAGMGAIQASNAGKAAQQQADYNAQIAGLQAKISQKNADAQQAELNYEAQQATTQAGQERAAAQQKMILQNKQTAIAQSRARALAAAGGGSVLDPSVVNIMGDLQTEGDYRAQTAMYEGEDAARSLEDTAALKTYQGKLAHDQGVTQAGIYDASASMYTTAGQNQANAGNVSAFTNILSGAGSAATLYDKYNTGTTVNWNDPYAGTGGYSTTYR